MKFLLLFTLLSPLAALRRLNATGVTAPSVMHNGQSIDVSAYSEAMQTSFHIVAKVKFNSMNANYPNILFGHDGSSMCFTSHGLGPAYGAKKGKACFYLQTTTNLGPHGRGIDYNGGWLPAKIRMDDQQWHKYELIKGVAGTALIVDGQRIEDQLADVEKDSSKFIMKRCTKIEVGKAQGKSGFDGEIGDVQIFVHGKQVFGPSLGSYDLAHGIAPIGSSDSHWGRFYGATDGLEDRVWHSKNWEHPSYLTLELAVPSKIDGMKILTPLNHLNYGFKTLEIFRSDDGKSWDLVRSDTVNECKKGRVSEHDGWGPVTKFVQIKMKDRCGGGAFAIAEWQVFGVPAENLAQGIVPSGSSDSKWGRFAGATDGKNDGVWHAGNGDYPSSLTLNLGLATSVSGMTLLTPAGSPNYGFKSLKIMRSMDGTSWTAVRTDSISECTASRSSFHPGWPEKTKYVKIEMSERCGGAHFAVVEWQIFGTQDKCKGKLLPESNDRFPCDSIKDETTCRKSYMKIPTGETFQCGVRKASEDVSNCLVVSECDVA